RHEALRTVFPSVGGAPVQRILPDVAVELTPVPVAADQLGGALAAESQRPFALAEGPLVRAKLFRWADDDHVLLLTIHHSVCDGWSMSTLIDELLSRYSGQNEVSVITPVANRPRVELESMVGFFVNSVVLRLDTSGSPTFRELIGRVREVAQSGMTHGGAPFDQVVEAVDPERSLSHTPLAQVMFALVGDPVLTVELDGLRVTSIDHHLPISKYDLTLELWPGEDDSLHGIIEYSTDLFDLATVERTVASLGRLLIQLTAAPGVPVGAAALLS